MIRRVHSSPKPPKPEDSRMATSMSYVKTLPNEKSTPADYTSFGREEMWKIKPTTTTDSNTRKSPCSRAAEVPYTGPQCRNRQ